MKRMLRTLLPGMTLVLLTAACSKHEGADPLDYAPSTMSLTSWVNIVKDSVPVTTTTEEGQETHNVDRTITKYLLFQTNNLGAIKTETVSKMYPKLNSDSLVNFQYTYSRPAGKIAYTGKDAIGYDVQAEAPFVVNGKTLLIDWGDNAAVYERRLLD